MIRRMQDPLEQEIALTLYRQGMSHDEVAKAMGFKTKTPITKELDIDPEFNTAVQAAMVDTFRPVLKHATELAMQADSEGRQEGALKALDMVMKWYSKVLDREHAEVLVDKKLEALEASSERNMPRMPVLSTPEAVQQFYNQVMNPAIEATSWEVTDETD